MARQTNNLRKIIQTNLKTLTTDVFYQRANDGAMFPHIVFTLDSMNMLESDANRHNYELYVDIYTLMDVFNAEELADQVEELFNMLNSPTDEILPTFYLTNRRLVIDENKDVVHRQIVFEVHQYERN